MKRLLKLLAIALVLGLGYAFGTGPDSALACLGLDHGEAGPAVYAVGAILNQNTVAGIFRTFSAIFTQAFSDTPTEWQQLAMRVPSSSREQSYNWLGVFPGLREWLGDRIFKNLLAFNYSITNKDWETSVEVDRNDILDDNMGIYNPLVAEMGRAVAAHPDELIFQTLIPGSFDTVCYDGQFMVDTDHPVGSGVQSNDGGGSGIAWYLLDLSRAMKPFIFQARQEPNFITKVSPSDESVFIRKMYQYGADRRDNAGYGLWQLLFGSKVTLNSANFKIARNAMMAFTDDAGKPLGVKPTHILVPPTLKEEAKKILVPNAEAQATATPWLGEVEIIESRWIPSS